MEALVMVVSAGFSQPPPHPVGHEDFLFDQHHFRFRGGEPPNRYIRS